MNACPNQHTSFTLYPVVKAPKNKSIIPFAKQPFAANNVVPTKDQTDFSQRRWEELLYKFSHLWDEISSKRDGRTDGHPRTLLWRGKQKSQLANGRIVQYNKLRAWTDGWMDRDGPTNPNLLLYWQMWSPPRNCL